MRVRLLLGLWSLVLALVLVELGARFWLTRVADEATFRAHATLGQQRERASRRGESAFKFSPHRYLGYVPAPNYHAGKNRHDPRGFRGEAVESPKPDGEYRIVCLGGSTTYTTFVEDWALAYPAQLELELRRRGHSVRVVNAGADGYSSYESLLNLELRVLDLEPDMVIVYHAVNDVTMRLVWPPEAYRGDNSGALVHSPGPAAQQQPAWQASTALRLLLLRFTRQAAPGALESNYVRFATTGHGLKMWYQLQIGTYPSAIFREVPVERMLEQNAPRYFERNLRNIIAVARQWQVTPVLATFAYSTATDDPPASFMPLVTELDRQNVLIRALEKEEAVPVFDFAARFPSDPGLFVDVVHVNAEGARLKAQLFADFLEQSGLLPP